jgi:Ca2+-dependent lipid-binding protein
MYKKYVSLFVILQCIPDAHVIAISILNIPKITTFRRMKPFVVVSSDGDGEQTTSTQVNTVNPTWEEDMELLVTKFYSSSVR